MNRISQERLDRLAYYLDDLFAIPGTKWRIGLDGLIGLIPGVGDVSTAVLSAWIIFQASRHNIPKAILLRMVGNMIIDFGLGSIPLVGDIFDVGWKANRRNMRLLRRYAKKEEVVRD
jgi:Domain of unknown function (DUF4112)